MKVVTHWPVRQRWHPLNLHRLGSIEDPVRRLLPDPRISSYERDGEKQYTNLSMQAFDRQFTGGFFLPESQR